MKTNDLLAGLPSEELIRNGLADLDSGRHTLAACLVAIARPRLVEAKLIIDPNRRLPPEPEIQLYRLLLRDGGDAYSRYNSLLRELVSFENALDHRTSAR